MTAGRCCNNNYYRWIFDDPACVDWNEPSGNMVGNGFTWGQATHMLAWVYQVTGLRPKTVHCSMVHSVRTTADIHSSAIIECENGATISFSGTCALPGIAHGDDATGKLLEVKVFGSEGAMLYGGDDRTPDSGRLELRLNTGEVQPLSTDFHFENCDEEGDGPESVQSFIAACRGEEHYQASSSLIGVRTVRTIDAMYRSARAHGPVAVLSSSDADFSSKGSVAS